MKKTLNLSDRAKSGRNGVQLIYVLDCIKSSSRDTDKEFATDFDALKFFFDTFNEEFNYANNKKMYPNLQERIGRYLKCIPGCCNIEFTNYDIIKLGIEWNILNDEADKKAGKFVENFFSVCALRIIQAANKVGININMYL